jgi:hypothetical protein
MAESLQLDFAWLSYDVVFLAAVVMWRSFVSVASGIGRRNSLRWLRLGQFLTGDGVVDNLLTGCCAAVGWMLLNERDRRLRHASVDWWFGLGQGPTTIDELSTSTGDCT